MKRVWCMLVCLLAALLLSVAAAAEDGTAAMTLMVYLCGSDLETNGGFATIDLSEMMEVPLPEDVNVIIQTGGAAVWQNE